MLPLLVLTPHSSAYVPVNVLTQMLGTTRFNNAHRTTFLEHLYFESDPYTDLIFHFPEAHFLAAKVSRFVVDVNRYRDDSSANGIIKLTDFNQIPLYPEGFSLSKKEREERLQRYFDSFHAELKALLARRPIRLLIDGHCMAPFGPNLGPDKGKARPAFTIMTGGDTQGEAVAGQRLSLEPEKARAIKALAEHHFEALIKLAPEPLVALNVPWDVDELSDTYSAAFDLPGFGFEINQALYLGKDYKPLPNKLKELNEAFSSFAKAAVSLFSTSNEVKV